MLTDEQIKKIAREYSEKGASSLGKEMGISKQRIFQLVVSLRKYGVKIPYINIRRGRLSIIAEELKAELKERDCKRA